ncbi:MAG: hypothetical protein MUE49_03890 [Rhodospirillales bacterium]|jgi:hypothetical protein|nr:hypothetical protein [Rhodospirillales bacterium]
MPPRLTRERIQQLSQRYRLDDHAVAEIIRSGASEPEFVEAVNRMSRGGEAVAFRNRPMSRTVARLCEVLASAGDGLTDAD